ncbi:sparc/osteonectin cwcv and kazal-like domains proteoglycan 1 [Cricetulus griseus]
MQGCKHKLHLLQPPFRCRAASICLLSCSFLSYVTCLDLWRWLLTVTFTRVKLLIILSGVIVDDEAFVLSVGEKRGWEGLAIGAQGPAARLEVRSRHHHGCLFLTAAPLTFPQACTDKELRNLASRLKDWFGALHEDANRVIKPTSSDTAQGRFDTSILPICKDSLGWMFNKLDMNYDLLLDHSEINAIYLDKYEPCIKPLFNSCDSFKDGKLSNNEWCYCFQKPGGLPCQNEMNRIQKLSKGKSLLGAFIPRCNEEGYYKATQCHGSTGQCWCVDKYGNELAGSRKQGAVSCEEEQETSGDFGSGGSVVLLDDLEDERELGPKDQEGKLRVHTRAVREDDEDEDDDKDDEIYLMRMPCFKEHLCMSCAHGEERRPSNATGLELHGCELPQVLGINPGLLQQRLAFCNH